MRELQHAMPDVAFFCQMSRRVAAIVTRYHLIEHATFDKILIKLLTVRTRFSGTNFQTPGDY